MLTRVSAYIVNTAEVLAVISIGNYDVSSQCALKSVVSRNVFLEKQGLLKGKVRCGLKIANPMLRCSLSQITAEVRFPPNLRSSSRENI